MRVSIEGVIYEGTPTEIMTELRDENFQYDEFPTIEDYIRHEQAMYVQFLEAPCPLPEHGTTDERAAALLHHLAEIDSLEVLEDA